ncbi:Chimeric ERCC6-PGBD3 protein [Amphibalanus amphitrite]|uniref:Chimeric ERCC6-PGBD3 protein n=1 Tax=Amphibalanus amphitrite TaxID=1232801 RepID=A0A6A4VS44_AMPAM|nr:Chimeric ERCC6-PGBD3 protein [Amphibalanus amphitrite]
MILLGSTEHGVEPSDTCKRYQKTSRSYIDVTRPAVVKAYNANMGGVDLNDRMIAHYRSGARTRKWTVQTILHFFDLSAVNAWLLYQQDAEEAGIKGAEMMKFLQFKYALAMQLLKGISSDGSSHSSSGSSDVEDQRTGSKEAPSSHSANAVTSSPAFREAPPQVPPSEV